MSGPILLNLSNKNRGYVKLYFVRLALLAAILSAPAPAAANVAADSVGVGVTYGDSAVLASSVLSENLAAQDAADIEAEDEPPEELVDFPGAIVVLIFGVIGLLIIGRRSKR